MLEDIGPDLIHAGPIQSCGYLTARSRFHPWLLTSWGSDILFSTDRARSGSRRRGWHCPARTDSFVIAIPFAPRQRSSPRSGLAHRSVSLGHQERTLCAGRPSAFRRRVGARTRYAPVHFYALVGAALWSQHSAGSIPTSIPAGLLVAFVIAGQWIGSGKMREFVEVNDCGELFERLILA